MGDITVLSIADTAVKIGLGGLISGLATYWVTRQKQFMDLQKDVLSERRTIIKLIVLDIARAEEVTQQYVHSVIQFVKHKKNESEGTEVEPHIKKVHEDVWNLSGNITKISAHVRLLGDEQVIGLWEKYRDSRSRLYKFCIKAKEQKEISCFEDEEWTGIMKDGNEAHDGLYRLLSKQYSS